VDEFGWGGKFVRWLEMSIDGLDVFFLNNERLVGVGFSSSYRIVRDVPKYCRYE